MGKDTRGASHFLNQYPGRVSLYGHRRIALPLEEKLRSRLPETKIILYPASAGLVFVALG
ncbi:hypothetical protein [Calothrix sp. PCC 6303]|uniref:hypothetical protein n=1 Tax=Calothrix sp. PCC 6303 TaxID=1170562 RepID=UPI0002A01197|nr:hypothetical protein [Calothrix sp. PCC 6303]AFZ02611.1 hypothetical protein Cal6303_3687 [Calothrix sp. PCC 6303]